MNGLHTDALAMVKASATQPETVFEGPKIPAGEDALLAEEQDYRYELDSEPEDGEGLADEDDGTDLGLEDGEEPWEEDDLHITSYNL